MATQTKPLTPITLNSRARRWLHFLRLTPLHPQFFAYKYEQLRYVIAGQHCKGRVLDIGCGRQPLKEHITPACDYISMDYPSTAGAYNALPAVLGDAMQLPFAGETFDTVVLLEVIEHLPLPLLALQEAFRILKPNGTIILSTPFIYPIHDAPYDYQRWTRHGIEELSKNSQLDIDKLYPLGGSLESSTLLFNLGFAWEALHAKGLQRIILLVLTATLAPLFNCIAIIFTSLRRDQSASPFSIGYLSVLRKKHV